MESRRSGGGTLKQASDWTKSQKMESPELFRLRARVRMISSSKKFSLEPKEVSTAKKNLNAKRKSTHMKNLKVDDNESAFYNVDPNSLEYQNAVLEDRINKHEKSMLLDRSRNGLLGHTSNGKISNNWEDYDGEFS